MAKEYWRWPESQWINPDIDWKAGAIVSAGIDVGSVSSQAVVLVDGRLYSYSNTRTGSDSPQSAHKVIEIALQDTDMSMDDVHYVVGTGYGRVNVPFAKKTLTEIACHARGANFIYGPTVRTILDMGGQDCKVIHCDSQGKVVNFLMNDKCAAGTGRGMEVLANLLSVPIADVGQLSFQVDEEPEPVSSTCVIFAKTEAVGLLRKGWKKEKVLASYSSAMAHRVVELLERISVEREFAITGGIAKNEGVVKRIEKELRINALEPKMDTQIAGALGGALFAKDLAEKEREIRRD
ncbi:benzoyl-CoA reductase, bzd-type, subunit Q [Acidobacteriota bacterium]